MNLNEFIATADLYCVKNYPGYELVGAAAMFGILKAVFTNGNNTIIEQFVSDKPHEIRSVARNEILRVHF